MTSSYSAQEYERIYRTKDWYGRASRNACMTLRYLPRFSHWLVSPIHDLGCGTGDSTRELRGLGHRVTGYDWIEFDRDSQVADISQPLPIEGGTAVCCDVIEHMPDEALVGLFENCKRADRQVFTIANHSAVHDGMELHINRKPFTEWREVLSQHFLVMEQEILQGSNECGTCLYLCESVR